MVGAGVPAGPMDRQLYAHGKRSDCDTLAKPTHISEMTSAHHTMLFPSQVLFSRNAKYSC